jgi:16S rRNA (adenine1518-N6/adenine1519-N6)-dimethyltransferase
MRPEGAPRPRRRFGQNFLTDARAVGRIVEALAPRVDETVVEIGPGRGALTEEILRRVPRLTAIEIDRDLAAMLSARFGPERLDLRCADILDVELPHLGTRLAIAGNLPYNVSKPVAMNLVRDRAAIDRAVLMFQREVAERLLASPDTPAYGPLTILAGLAFRIERVFDLPPGAFTPRPAVVSTVTRWTRAGEERLDPDIEARLRAVLRASFARRRQTLLRNLRSALPGGEAQARAILERTAIDGSLRAEALATPAFLALAAAWPRVS